MPIKDKYDITENYVISESPKYFFLYPSFPYVCSSYGFNLIILIY